MGIRFFCDHCQQLLNVKAYQAGEEGVCPKCERPIRVPEISTATPKDQIATRKHKQAESCARNQAMEVDRNTFPESGQTDNFVEPTSGQSRTEQPTVEAADRRAQHAAPADFPVHSADLPDQGNFLLDKPVNPCLRPNAPDPVESGLKKIWYVRYPKAGEDGPIKGKRIAKMLKDKKIFAGCYVWREDWEDWIRAELIFRELMPEQAAMPDNRLFTDANASIPKSYQMKAQAQANAKKRRLTLGVVAIVIGMVTIGLLVWLLTTMW